MKSQPKNGLNNHQISSSPHIQVLGPLRLVDGVAEEVDVPGQRVLVHRVDVGQVGDAEEQDDAAVDRYGRVGHTGVVDFDLSLLRGGKYTQM